MLGALVVIIILLWFVGLIQLPYINTVLLTALGHAITLHDVLLFVLFCWVISILPRPFREIAGVLGILWILSILGILAISGLSNILVLAIIVGILFSLFMQ